MRRRRVRPQHSISLFPFLAVLICTFGVLIVLLVIVVKAADQSAQQAREQSQHALQEGIASKQLSVELQQIRVDGFRTLQPQLVQDLQNEKNRQAHLQAELQQLSEELKALAAQSTIAVTKVKSDGFAELEGQLSQLQQQLADEQDLLAKKRTALNETSARTKFSVVPYSGDNGTARIPIYIECDKDGIKIQPFDVNLKNKDFVYPILPNNPLDAALIAVKEYFIRNQLLKEGETPYPLLIVRPAGAESYALARHAMKSWDEEFGYELIDSNIELDFGSVDSQLEAAVLTAVDAARRRQQAYIAEQVLQRQSFDERPVSAAGGLQASGPLGGFVPSSGHTQRVSYAQKLDVSKNDGESSQNAASGDSADSQDHRNADIAFKGVEGVKSIADDKGKDWALPSRSPGAIAYRRPVKIVLQIDQINIPSDSQSNQTVKISVLDDRQSYAQALVEAIWKRIDTWGVAGAGGFWKPELDIEVEVGAEERFQELSALLKDSGLIVKENRQ